MSQTIQQFIAKRRPRWERLEQLVLLLERGKTKSLNATEIVEISRLYREATADLARLQTARRKDMKPGDLEIYLNNLVARSYGRIYRSPSPGLSSLIRFIRYTIPETFRATSLWTFIAFAVFLIGSTYGFVSSVTDDSFIPLIVPPHLIAQVEGGDVWFDSILAISPLASSMIMTNNISVAFLAFAFGMTLGIGTTYIMGYNGLLLGTLAGLCHIHGLDSDFWSFVLPHGVIELTAIFISGGSGYLLSTALIAPGDFPRKEALIVRGRQAVKLVLGCVPLLVVAGIIEGFFSPTPIPASLKYFVAGLLFVLLLFYLFYKPPIKDLSSSLPYNSQGSLLKARME
jgi:uncharacterized membrane protein SpoIIM required for sporulation